MDDPESPGDPEPVYTRPPRIEDLRSICGWLEEEAARYAVIGGMAMNHYGAFRATFDIDLLVDDTEDNVARVLRALARLPDGAAREAEPRDVLDYTVLRINDEITVDVLAKTCGLRFRDLEASLEIDRSQGVPIYFASADDVIRTKQTVREKDRVDCEFLRERKERLQP